MTAFYDKLALTAARLLKSKGQQLTFTRRVEGAYDSATGTVDITETTFKANCAAFNYDNRMIDGTNIRSTDIRLLVEQTKNVPQVADVVTIGGRVYALLTVRPLSPGGTLVISECQARAGTDNGLR